MNKKISVGLAGALMFLAMAVTATVSVIASMNLFDSKVISVKSSASTYDKLYEMNTIVSDNFYYSIDAAETKDSVSYGYVEGLRDPDTEFLTAQDIELRNKQKTGQVVSAGLVCAKDIVSGYLKIEKILDGSSAEEAGMIDSDVIISIDGVSVAMLEESDALALLEGGLETKLSVTYTRDSAENTVELTRTQLIDDSVISGQYDNYYYIRVLTFCDTTSEQFMQAIKNAEELESIGLIIDLRNTFGGYDLGVAADILDVLLPEGTTILADYGDGEMQELYTSDSDCVSLPIVVMVNESTVGYSEIVASVLSENALTSSVGKTTAGKGSLQKLFTLTDGSGLNLTIAMLYSKSGKCINSEGVKPVYEVDSAEEFILGDGLPDEEVDVQFKRAKTVLASMF